MVVWTATLLAIAYERHAEFRLRALRPREHGAGGLEHGARARPRGDGRCRRASSSCAWACTSIRSSRCSRPLWIVFPSPVTLITIQVVAVASGALPGVLARAAAHGIGAGRRPARADVSRVSVDRVDRARRVPPGGLAIPLLLFCVWFLDSDRLVPFAVCAVLVAGTGELMALAVAALGVWYALARGRRRAGAVASPAPDSSGRWSPWPSSCPPSSGARACSTGTTRRSAARRPGSFVPL